MPKQTHAVERKLIFGVTIWELLIVLAAIGVAGYSILSMGGSIPRILDFLNHTS